MTVPGKLFCYLGSAASKNMWSSRDTINVTVTATVLRILQEDAKIRHVTSVCWNLPERILILRFDKRCSCLFRDMSLVVDPLCRSDKDVIG
jgi:hypothetical protein